MSDAAIQRPSPTKRGRGRGRGGGARGGASARARGKAAAGRRGRAKVYETSRAQAAHERQRDLKNAYATLAAAMKPALEELADRNLDRLKSDFNAHQEVDEYIRITSFLDERIADRRSVIAAKLDLSIGCQKHQLAAQSYYQDKSYTTRCADKVEEYYDVLLRRLDILQQLYTNGDPVDKQDDSWNFKSITTAEAAEQGIYCKIFNGVEVPYPHLHPELAQEASKTKSLRTPSKRKPLSLLEESTPRRPVSALDDKPPAAIPRHIGGLLSAVAPDEPVSQPPSPSPIDDNGDVPSPPANEPAAPGRGRKRKMLSAEPDESEAGEDEAMPPLPNGAAEPDEHGVRLINKRARVNDMPNNRIMVPPLFDFEDHEIGFRDSTNDKSRGATKAKRRKFLNQPNSGAMFFDRNLCSYDATQYTDGELDQARVQEHSLHPKYGFFLANSTNESAPAKPYESGWKPTVFVSEDGKVLHTSRSIAAAKAEGAFIKFTMQDSMKQHMNEEEITESDLLDSKTQQLITQRDAKRREFEQQEDRAQDEHQQQVASHNVSLLLNAATAAAIPVKQEMQVQNESPALLRPANMSRPYDAIRDVFGGGSDLQPAASGAAAPIDNSAAMNLLLLADVAFQNEQGFEAPPAQPPVAKEALRIPIQMPEPVRPKQLRDPSDLEQPEMPIVDYPDPDNEFVPRQLAFPNNFVGRPHDFTLPPAHAYQDRAVPPSPLAHPDSFGFREAASSYDQQQQQQQREQQPRQVMRPPQPYIGQKGHPPPQGVPEHYGYGEPEAVHEQQSRLRRQSQMSQRSEDQYNPPRPNTEDVALLDPMLFEGGQRPAPSQLQAPQPEQAKTQMPQHQGGVLQQPQNSFFQTALNSPSTPTLPDQLRAPEYPEPSQAHQQPGPPLAPAPHGFSAHDGSPGRTPFSNPSGTENQPLPPLRPLHRGSGPGMPGPHMPQHMMMPPNEAGDPYAASLPPPPPGSMYPEQAYPMDGFGPDQPLMSTEQVSRAGYMVQPPLHPSQQPPYSAYPPQQVYLPPGQVIAQAPPQNDYAPSGPPIQVLQSPPPYGNSGPGVSPSPSRRSNSISSSSRNNKQYREIKPAPRQAEAWDNGSSELRTFMYNPVEGIRDYPATAPPPSHGPTQIRGWTHSTGTRKQRAKNSTDSQIDPSLGREEKK